MFSFDNREVMQLDWVDDTKESFTSVKTEHFDITLKRVIANTWNYSVICSDDHSRLIEGFFKAENIGLAKEYFLKVLHNDVNDLSSRLNLLKMEFFVSGGLS